MRTIDCPHCKRKYWTSQEWNGYAEFSEGLCIQFSCSCCKDVVYIPITKLDENGVICPNCHSMNSLRTWNPHDCNCPYCNSNLYVKSNTESGIDTRPHSVHDLEQFNYLSDGESFTLGKPLPWNNNIFGRTGSYICVHLSERSFDIVISLPDFSYNEERAILEDAFQFAYIVSDHGPYMMLNFGKVFSCSKHLNIWFLEEDDRVKWIHAPADKFRIFLLNGNDATLLGMREAHSNQIMEIKDYTSFQFQKRPMDIEEFFIALPKQYPFDLLFASIKKKEEISAVKHRI